MKESTHSTLTGWQVAQRDWAEKEQKMEVGREGGREGGRRGWCFFILPPSLPCFLENHHHP
jgi:hypothetical protein